MRRSASLVDPDYGLRRLGSLTFHVSVAHLHSVFRGQGMGQELIA